MIQLTKDMILAMHSDLIRTGGQVDGVLCEGTIDHMLDLINSTHGVYAKAALSLLMSRYHPFFDGNKRISFVLAATILRMGGHYLGRQDEDEIYCVLHKISDSEIECDLQEIELWLKKKSKTWFKARQRNISDYL